MNEREKENWSIEEFLYFVLSFLLFFCREKKKEGLCFVYIPCVHYFSENEEEEKGSLVIIIQK